MLLQTLYLQSNRYSSFKLTWNKGLRKLVITGWYSKDPALLRLVGHAMLQHAVVDMRGPKRFYIAHDVFKLSTLPQVRTADVVARAVQRVLGREFFSSSVYCCLNLSLQMWWWWWSGLKVYNPLSQACNQDLTYIEFVKFKLWPMQQLPDYHFMFV